MSVLWWLVEPLLVLVLAAPLAWWVGRLSGARWALARLSARGETTGTTLDDRDAVCGCEHHLALHDLATNACHGRVVIANVLRPDGRRLDRLEPCACRRYVGPVPVEELLTPRPWTPRVITGEGRER